MRCARLALALLALIAGCTSKPKPGSPQRLEVPVTPTELTAREREVLLQARRPGSVEGDRHQAVRVGSVDGLTRIAVRATACLSGSMLVVTKATRNDLATDLLLEYRVALPATGETINRKATSACAYELNAGFSLKMISSEALVVRLQIVE